MRNPERIKPFLEKLENLWLKHPYLRFGQLVKILEFKAENKDLFYLEEEDLEKLIKSYE